MNRKWYFLVVNQAPKPEDLIHRHRVWWDARNLRDLDILRVSDVPSDVTVNHKIHTFKLHA